MRAIILAAGEGTRLKKYTRDLPKGMLVFGRKTLIERQIETLIRAGINDISIVKGFAAEKIRYEGVNYYVNREYNKTNMVVSLFCAREKLEGEVIVSYADIVYEDKLLSRLIDSDNDITVTVDTSWETYWNERYGKVEFDLESLRIEGESIVSLGKENPSLSEIDARYVGLLKFRGAGVDALKRIWSESRDEYWDRPWQVSGKTLRNAYMTDMIQALIDEGYDVRALKCEGGWLEFDTNEDYEKANEWLEKGTINKLIDLEKNNP